MVLVRTLNSGKARVLLTLIVVFVVSAHPAVAQPSGQKTGHADTRPAERDSPSNTQRARRLISEGLAAYDDNRLEKARNKFQKAVKAGPRIASAHFNLGSIYYEQNQLDSAARHYHRAVELDPKDASAHYYLGLSYLDLKKTVDARFHFRRALELDPSMAKASRRLNQIPPVADREEPESKQESPVQSHFDAKSNFLLGLYYPGMSLGYQTSSLTTEARFASANDIRILSLRFKNHLWRYSSRGTIYGGTELGKVWFEGTSAEGTGQIVSGFGGFRHYFLPFLSFHMDVGPQFTRLSDSQTNLRTSGLDFIINTGITLHFFGENYE